MGLNVLLTNCSDTFMCGIEWRRWMIKDFSICMLIKFFFPFWLFYTQQFFFLFFIALIRRFWTRKWRENFLNYVFNLSESYQMHRWNSCSTLVRTFSVSTFWTNTFYYLVSQYPQSVIFHSNTPSNRKKSQNLTSS